MNPRELAEKIGISQQTATTYCRKLGLRKVNKEYQISPDDAEKIAGKVRYFTFSSGVLFAERLMEYERQLRARETRIYTTPIIGRIITIGQSLFIPQPEAGTRRCLYCWYNSRLSSVGGCPYLLNKDGGRDYPCIDYKLVYYPAAWNWRRWEERVRGYFGDVDEREKEDI